MPDSKPYKPPYQFSVTIGETCTRKMRTFVDLAEKLNMDVTDLMRQCNGHAPPSKALVKGLAKELDITESYLDKLAEEVRMDLESRQIDGSKTNHRAPV
jgi:transcriptional regulator with XRE-family HTH domain